MEYNLIITISLIIYLTIFLVGLYYISISINNYNKLILIKEKTILAETKKEISDLWDELNELRIKCRHNFLKISYMEIETILKTKYDTLNNIPPYWGDCEII